MSETLTPRQRVERALGQGRQALEELSGLVDQIEAAGRLVEEVLAAGNKVLICGNGGSAAQAQHFAGELVGRFCRERRGLPAIALTTDTSILTAVANDYAFERVFARQVEALAGPGDLLWALSTSGESANVLRALEAGRAAGCRSLCLGGRDGGAMVALADCCLAAPADDTARIQELHLLLGHLICELVEAAL
jgi:D-sedoheptulose 7-phosphate isomerase